MKCDTYENMLPLYLEGNLQSSLLRNMEDHTRQCSSCSSLLHELKEADKLLSIKQQIPIILPSNFEDRIFLQIKKRAAYEPARLFSVALCALSVILCLTVFSDIFAESGIRTINLILTIGELLRTEPAILPTLRLTMWPFMGFVFFMTGMAIYGITLTQKWRNFKGK